MKRFKVWELDAGANAKANKVGADWLTIKASFASLLLRNQG